MNAQTRREMALRLMQALDQVGRWAPSGNARRFALIDAALREWGLEMAKIAAETEIVLDNHPAWGFSVRCEKAARLITRANANAGRPVER